MWIVYFPNLFYWDTLTSLDSVIIIVLLQLCVELHKTNCKLNTFIRMEHIYYERFFSRPENWTFLIKLDLHKIYWIIFLLLNE